MTDSQVLLLDEAKEDLRDFDGATRKMLLKAIGKLRQSPDQRGEPLGSRANGNLTGFRKLVVGNRDYRIVYDVRDDGTVVVIWVIGRRVNSEAYALAQTRIELYATDINKKTALLGLLERVRYP
ncbi:MAG: type II toxin-antitoxin system RelE/ParE family toxin [Cellulomonadaceae bacterium]|nr:type II toxin-antitoxin system RelE/ParE family toxin [Cellulomonadaceae bacterium]